MNHDRLYAKSNCTGRNWFTAFVYGSPLRTNCVNCGGIIHSNYRSTWCIWYRSDLQKSTHKSIEIKEYQSAGIAIGTSKTKDSRNKSANDECTEKLNLFQCLHSLHNNTNFKILKYQSMKTKNCMSV